MAGPQPKWTTAQREAFIAAVLDGGYTTPAAVKAAHAGTLPGLEGEPFEIGKSYAVEIAARARRKRELERQNSLDPAAMNLETRRDLTAAREVIRRKLRREREDHSSDADVVTRLAKALAAIQREIDSLAKSCPPSPNGKSSPNAETPTPEEPASIVTRLAVSAGESEDAHASAASAAEGSAVGSAAGQDPVSATDLDSSPSPLPLDPSPSASDLPLAIDPT